MERNPQPHDLFDSLAFRRAVAAGLTALLALVLTIAGIWILIFE